MSNSPTPGNPPAPPGPRLPRLRLKILLPAVLLAVLLPALAIGGYATWCAVRMGHSGTQARLADTAAALALAVDREIGGYWSAATALAASRSLDGPRPDLAGFEIEARRVAQALGTSLVLLEGPTLRQVVNTALPPGAPASAVPAADFGAVLHTGRPLVTDLVRGATSGRLVVGAAVPVARAGQPPYVLAARLAPERLRQLLAAQALPPGVFAGVVDGRGAIVARSDGLHEARVGQAVPADVRAQYEGLAAGAFRAETLDDVDHLIAFRAVPAAPSWRVFVAEPASVPAAAWHTPVLALTAGGAALLLAAGVLAVLTGRGVLRPVHALRRRPRSRPAPGRCARARTGCAPRWRARATPSWRWAWTGASR